LSNSTQEDVLHIDPVRMNLINRIASGSIAQGNLAFAGGLLLQGQWVGNGIVKGSLVVWHEALLTGHFKIEGDLYVVGQLGERSVGSIETLIECGGTTYMASTAQSSAKILTVHLKLYDGANIGGVIKTMKSAVSHRQFRA
jgi:hypothetical protein